MRKHGLMYSEANGETNVLQRVLHIQMQKHEHAHINTSTGSCNDTDRFFQMC